MTIYSLVAKRIEDGGWTGACRFDSQLREVFPGLQSITPAEAPKKFGREDVVIADNHLSLLAPANTRTIVVAHGCARTHYERDPYWRTGLTKEIVAKQGQMTMLPNRKWVAPSAWVADEFSRHNPDWIREVHIIPHWVESLDRHPDPAARPVIIGDWRDYNKGSEVWRRLQDRFPGWEFRPLSFRDDAGRRRQYAQASLYLCLSLSEGGSYSMCDAEAASIPILTTDVGNYREFREASVIPWGRREDPDLVGSEILRKLDAGRGPSFYRNYSFSIWADAWKEVVA